MARTMRSHPGGVKADVARRVRDVLRAEIKAVRFKDGLLPSESTLMARENASRNAVRLALSLLRSESLVRRLQGVGTMVVGDRHNLVPLDPPLSVTHVFEGRPQRVRYEVLSFEVKAAPPGIAGRLEIVQGEDVAFIERLTLLDERPFTLNSAWIPARLAAPILGSAAKLQQGVFDILENELLLDLGVSEYVIEATAADETVASYLDVPVGTPLLMLETLTRDAAGVPVEFGYGRGRADRVRYVTRGFHCSRDGAGSAAGPLDAGPLREGPLRDGPESSH